MKKLLSITMLLAFTIAGYAQQEKEVTQFLGIPVDGSKTEMIEKLKAKGFQSSETAKFSGCDLEGEFNGYDVLIGVVTNKSKVYRIYVEDKNRINETSIKIRFNKLCEQFANNPKYISLQNYTIPENEDISYQISAHNKRYQAAFYQIGINNIDAEELKRLKFTLFSKYSEEQLENPSKETQWEIIYFLMEYINKYSDNSPFFSKLKNFFSKYTKEQLENPTEEVQLEIIKLFMDLTELCSKKTVWFKIDESYGGYYITMYYDNGYNQANGEDL